MSCQLVPVARLYKRSLLQARLSCVTSHFAAQRNEVPKFAETALPYQQVQQWQLTAP